MFNVGDEVICIDNLVWSPVWGRSYVKGLKKSGSTSKVYVVTNTQNYSDGSQRLWVMARRSVVLRGPYCSLRFEKVKSVEYQYDPNQTGDTDEDI
ncbi:hypothetical protein EVB79_013 [Rhizobium phage RHph_N3_13]|nr:hypothetical protein EVB79_013 [Rhizobium phage RHph_N3_13]